MGIDNVLIELNSPEVPIMDGSAAPFIYLIHEAGVEALQAPRKYLKIVRRLRFRAATSAIALYPSDHFKVTYSISYDHPLLRHQSRTLRITEETFIEESRRRGRSRSSKDVEMLRQNGLALGGSLDNAIVLGETGVLNNALRFEDEFVRHKILDAVGDLALVGYPVIGHLVAHRAGHALHTEFAAEDSRRDPCLAARRSAGRTASRSMTGAREERGAPAGRTERSIGSQQFTVEGCNPSYLTQKRLHRRFRSTPFRTSRLLHLPGSNLIGSALARARAGNRPRRPWCPGLDRLR